MSEFSGYSAVVTGGSMDIGAATARALCRAGARVTVLDVQDGSALAGPAPGAHAVGRLRHGERTRRVRCRR